MDFEIRGQTFKIDFVSNYVIEQYQEVESLAFQLTDLITEVEKLGEKFSDNPDEKEVWKEAQKIQRRRADIEAQIIPIRREIIKEIIETNGMEYDEKFWTRKTSPNDINEFILSCVRKDLNDKGSKKK
jgi:hypothetical protein